MQIFRRFFTTFIEQHLPPPGSTSQDFLTTTTSNKIGTFPNNIYGLENLEWLFSIAPCFIVNGNQIKILHEPSEFYDTLLEKCSNAKKRIILASLYLGTGKLENQLLNAMKTNLQMNKNLKVNILLDYTRGTRGHKINSKSMLLPLIQENSNNENSFKLSLYHTPVLRGITKQLVPSRWNELLGLQHMKIYLFDNSVIISGANLSNDYFTNRQDRYIMINDKNIADFYEKFLNKVQEFCLNVNKFDKIELHKNWKLLPYEANKLEFAEEARKRILDFFKETFYKQKLEIENKFQESKATDTNIGNDTIPDTWIFPLIEMGQLGIHHDSIVTKKLLSSAIEGSKFKLATGYFNLTEEYMKTITNDCLAECSILMAHPNVRI